MTPEEFAQLQPGDVIVEAGHFNKDYWKIIEPVSTKEKRFEHAFKIQRLSDNEYSEAFLSSFWSLFVKAEQKKEMRFEIGKQYKNINKQKIHTCIAFSPEGWPILRGDPSYTNVIILKPDSHVKDHWEEYIPPVIHKRYIHWYRTHSKSNMFVHASDNKLEYISGCPVLHVQEVSFEEKKNV